MQSKIAMTLIEPKADDKRERARQLLVNLVFSIYWLLIFDGAFRKWILPSFDTVLYFIKDPLILAVYWVAFKNRLWPRANLIAFGVFLLSAIYFLLALLQIVLGHSQPLVVVFGLRNYVWCLPLAVLIGWNFRGQDIARLIRQTMFVSIPIAILVYFQFRSPPSHWINTYVGGTDDPAMVGSTVRTCGTFAYITGQTAFVSTLLPMLVSFWLLPKQHRPLGLKTGVIASLAVLVNFALNGSRSILVGSALTLLGAVGYVLLTIDSSNRQRIASQLAAIVLICGTTGVLLVTVFPTALEGQIERFSETDGGGTPIFERWMKTFSDLFVVLPSVSILGQGLGIGSSGGAAISGGQRAMLLAENELPRVMMESGLAGLVYLAFRELLGLWLIVGAIKASKLSKNPFPVLWVPSVAMGLASGQLTMGGVLMYGGWISVGISIAANQLGQRSLES